MALTPPRQANWIPTDQAQQTFDASDDVFEVQPSSHVEEPLSPFASPIWPRTTAQDLIASRSLPVPVRREEILRSNSFQSRQLSFQDWCFNPAVSIEQLTEQRSQKLKRLPSFSPELDLMPKHCPPIQEVYDNRPQNQPEMCPRSGPPSAGSSPSSSSGIHKDVSALDLDDLLACKEVLTSNRPVEYLSPPGKRRRGCYAF